jgi:hypothetical protein
MTLFQVVRLNTPIELTPEGQKHWEMAISYINPVLWKGLLISSLEAVEEGLSLTKNGSEAFFMEKIDRDLNS